MDSPSLVVSVKNTFLDFVEETPEAPDLARGKTEPAPARSYEVNDDETDEVVARSYDDDDETDNDDDDETDEVVAPAALPLCRYVTADFFEPAQEWQWTSPQTDQIEPAQTDQPASAPAPTQAAQPQGMVGLMYLGTQMVPVYPVAFSSQQLPPLHQNQCVPSTDLRGIRWPAYGGAPLEPAGLTGGERASVPEPPPVPGLDRHFSANSQLYRIHWTIPEKRLRSSDKVAVSPPFELRGAKWKLMLSPVIQHNQRCGSSFKGAKGKAVMKLKCEDLPSDAPATLMFRFFAGKSAPRGPGSHDFSKSSVGTIPSNEVWDLTEHVRQGTVTVGAEIWLV